MWQYGAIVDQVEVPQRHMKGRKAYTAHQKPVQVACHSLRKRFVMRVHAFHHGDLLKIQKALGHVNINSTIKYLALDEVEVDADILAA